MITPLLAASEVPDFVLTTLKILSVIGIAALGGLLLAWVAAVVTKLYFGQTIGPRVSWFIRTLGAVASGLVAWALLFNAGGSGIGGGGWWPGGGGTKDGYVKHEDKVAKKDETPIKEQDKQKDKDKVKEKGKDKGKGPTGPLVVEVLGDKTLEKLAGGKQFNPEKRYRVMGIEELTSLDEVKKLIQTQRDGDPPLAVLEIVLNEDSPARNLSWVRDLEAWANDLPPKKGKKLSIDVRLKG